ncbi:hypothetical protein BH11PSE10_BH11PSE10_10690 [soil metagenome]
MNTLRHALLSAALLASAVTTAQAAGSLVLSPPAATVNPGDSFALLVRGSGFTDNVVGGGFNLSFDANMLALNSVTVDTVVWEFVSSPGSIDNAAGTLSDVYFNSFKAVLPTGNFNVASLQFTAKASGNSAVVMSDSASFPFANDLAEVIPVAYQGAAIGVSAVPEPQTGILLMLGLASLGLLRRKH